MTSITRRWFFRLAAPTLAALLVSILGADCDPPPPSGCVGDVNTAVTGSRLIVSAHGAVVTFRRDGTLDGPVPPAMILSGDDTQLDRGVGLGINSAGNLIYGIDDSLVGGEDHSILVYADDTRLNCNQAPIRVVRGPNTQLVGLTAIALDVARDIVYAAVEGRILVFTGTSSANFNGDIAPARTIENGLISDVRGMAVGPDDRLYVAATAIGNVLIYLNASTIDGDKIQDLSLDTEVGSAIDVTLDDQDNLYVLAAQDGGSADIGRIVRFEHVSTFVSATPPTAFTVVEQSFFPQALEVSSDGTAFFSGNAQLFIIDDIANADENTTPSATVKGIVGTWISPSYSLAVD